MATSNDTIQANDGSWITDVFLQDIIQRIHHDQEVTIISKDIQLALGKGENYLSKIFRVLIHYMLGGAETKRSIIIKSFPVDEFFNKFVTQLGLFDRELSIYRDALPALYKFAKEKIKHGLVPCISPTSFTTYKPNVVVLDDLKYQGFKMADRKKLLDLQHCRLVVTNLARFHGISAALHEQNPDILSQYDDMVFSESNRETLETLIPLQMKSMVKIVKSWPGYETYADKLEKMTPEYLNKLRAISKPQEDGFNVLCHGDCWTNNYLFQYSPTEEPTDIRFVDFQLSRLGSPALDLSYFLYTSPRIDVRETHLEELLSEYHKQLCETLTSLGCNPDVFSFDDLKNEMKRVAYYGFYAAHSLIPIVVAEAGDTPDLTDLNEEDPGQWNKTQSNPRFKEALQPLLRYFDKLGTFD